VMRLAPSVVRGVAMTTTSRVPRWRWALW
jgi:hypothetical protein